MTNLKKKIRVLRPEFVDSIPEKLTPGVLYVSTKYATASHLCASGCGQEVVTPIRPTDWSLTWNGDAVSLRPSIGNWALPCRSHYWVGEGGKILWAGDWTDSLIAKAGQRAVDEKQMFYSRKGRRSMRKLA